MAPPPPFPESAVAVMKEHSKEVFVLAWNPRYDLLATGCVEIFCVDVLLCTWSTFTSHLALSLFCGLGW